MDSDQLDFLALNKEYSLIKDIDGHALIVKGNQLNELLKFRENMEERKKGNKKIEKNRRKKENIRRLKNNKGVRSEHNWEKIEEWKSRIK